MNSREWAQVKMRMSDVQTQKVALSDRDQNQRSTPNIINSHELNYTRIISPPSHSCHSGLGGVMQWHYGWWPWWWLTTVFIKIVNKSVRVVVDKHAAIGTSAINDNTGAHPGQVQTNQKASHCGISRCVESKVKCGEFNGPAWEGPSWNVLPTKLVS